MYSIKLALSISTLKQISDENQESSFASKKSFYFCIFWIKSLDLTGFNRQWSETRKTRDLTHAMPHKWHACHSIWRLSHLWLLFSSGNSSAICKELIYQAVLTKPRCCLMSHSKKLAKFESWLSKIWADRYNSSSKSHLPKHSIGWVVLAIHQLPIQPSNVGLHSHF